MIVRMTDLTFNQLKQIDRGTILLDYQMHPYVTIETDEVNIYLCDMGNRETPLSFNDGIPMFVKDADEIIEKNDWCGYRDWYVII